MMDDIGARGARSRRISTSSDRVSMASNRVSMASVRGPDEGTECHRLEIARTTTKLISSTTSLYTIQPWLDDTGKCIWDPVRVRIGKVVLSDAMEVFIMIVIFLNLVLIVYETDKEADCYPQFKDDLDKCPNSSPNLVGVPLANNLLLIMYTLEAIVLIYLLRRAYFKKISYVFDFCIVLAGWSTLFLSSIIPKTSWFRVLRFGRIFKVIHLGNDIPELYMLVAGLIGAMKAMVFGAIFLACMLLCFAIVMVQLIHPIVVEMQWKDCSRCRRSFHSIGESMLTLFQQIVAGDSWGLVSVPVVEEDPLGMLLPFTQLVIGVGAMNLILAVVVDRAMDARQADRNREARKKLQEQEERKKKVVRVLENMDTDGSGTICYDELCEAAQTSREFVHLLAFSEIKDTELAEIAEALEDATTKDIDRERFCDVLDDIEAGDVRKSVVLLRLGVASMKRDICSKLDKQARALEEMKRELGHQRRLNKKTDAEECKISASFARTETSALLESIRDCRLRINNEVRCLREDSSKLNVLWQDGLRDFVNASAAAISNHRSEEYVPGKDVESAIPFLQKNVVECLHGQRNALQRREARQLENFVRDLEEDVASLLRQCSFLDAYEDSTPVDFHHNVCSANPVHTPSSLRSPRSPRVEDPSAFLGMSFNNEAHTPRGRDRMAESPRHDPN